MRSDGSPLFTWSLFGSDPMNVCCSQMRWYQSHLQWNISRRISVVIYRAGVGKVRWAVSGCNLLISGVDKNTGRSATPAFTWRIVFGPWDSAAGPLGLRSASMRSDVELGQDGCQSWARTHGIVILGRFRMGTESNFSSTMKRASSRAMFQQIWAEWRSLTGDLSSLVTLYGAARRLAPTEKYHRCQFTVLHAEARLLLVEVTQTSARALLLKQQRRLQTRGRTCRKWNICSGYWRSRSVYRFAISERNLSKWGCDLFAVVCSCLKGHISGQKRRLKGSTSLRDPLKSIQGMKTLLSPLRLRDQFSFIQRSSENCNLKFVNAESWARRQMRIIFSFSKDTAETE